QRSVALLKDAERLQDDVRAHHAGLTGELRITTTSEFGSRVVVPLLARFSHQHPDLRVRHASSSLPADLISERFDVAIRLGTLVDSRNHAALISHFSILPVATPEWLARNPIDSLA
ncbi:LysR substrate-binding domain-containing protein, partial [Enterobacter cloacae]|uniref:LysR substrate-binding domain-containing protein n=1 Tax=Enterobacter cloacae TaxID=550 RepID=UPI0021CF1710